MDFVKKNLIMIISAVVMVLSLVLIFLGMSRVGSVKEDMAATESQLSAVESLARGVPVPDPKGGMVNLIPTAKNVKAIKDVSAQAKAKGFKLLEVTLKENVGFDPKTEKIKRIPFLDGIFPKPVNDAQPYRFRPAYKEALDQILKTMDAGTVPSSEDLETSEEELAQEMGFLMDEILSPDSVGVRSSKRNSRNKSNTSNEEELKKMAVKMAADKRASGIKVYCGTKELDVISSCLTASGTAPAIDEMWWAQLSVWLQQDFAAAIAEANASAKNVTESVVKRILSIEMMHGYLLSNGFIGRQENTKLPDSFTGLESNDHYDMLHFGITMVVDAQRIPDFINAMYKQNHYVLYSWKIEEMEESSSGSRGGNQVNAEELYRYGTAPVVKLTTYWEGYLLRDFYHWGIVGYDLNKETGKPVLVMYNGERKEVDDIENRDNLAGLMPKAIREALTDDSEGGSGGNKGGFGF